MSDHIPSGTKPTGTSNPKGELLSESALETIKERAHSVWVRYQVCSKHLTQDEQEIAQLLRHIDALQSVRAALRLILPLAKGYAPSGQSDSARKTCREWVQAAEDALEGGSDETVSPPLGYEDIEGELERVTARLNAVWSHCRVIFFPPMDDPRGNYYLEHAPNAGKDMRATIEHRLSEITKPTPLKAVAPLSTDVPALIEHNNAAVQLANDRLIRINELEAALKAKESNS